MTGAVRPLHGWRVVWAAFLLAVFGWGLGLYGPPIYLHAVREQRGWALSLVSAAVTMHFLLGALVVSQLPALHRRLGLVSATRLAGLLLGVGIAGWALAHEPWQLFLAAMLSGAGWGGTSAAAINAIIAPWFVRHRPRALAVAYNGASAGGLVFQPLWVAGILYLGYPLAAVCIGIVTVLVVGVLSGRWFACSPAQLGQQADGDVGAPDGKALLSAGVAPLPGAHLRQSRRFKTLNACMTLSLFAQTGLLVHLFSHLVPALGAAGAGWLMTAATLCGMGGRLVVARNLGPQRDRRLALCANLILQICGILLLLAAAGSHLPLLIAGMLVFGVGIGNAVSLPPLIAQAEFAPEDVARVVALIVATSQATYAFAPSAFSLLPDLSTGLGATGPAAPLMFLVAAGLNALAVGAVLIGRRRP